MRQKAAAYEVKRASPARENFIFASADGTEEETARAKNQWTGLAYWLCSRDRSF